MREDKTSVFILSIATELTKTKDTIRKLPNFTEKLNLTIWP